MGDLVRHLVAVALLEVAVPSSAVPGHPLLGLLRDLHLTLLTAAVSLAYLAPSLLVCVVDRV